MCRDSVWSTQRGVWGLRGQVRIRSTVLGSVLGQLSVLTTVGRTSMVVPTSLHTWQCQSDPLVLKCPTHSPTSPPCNTHTQNRERTKFVYCRDVDSVHETAHHFVFCPSPLPLAFLQRVELLAPWHISLWAPLFFCFSRNSEKALSSEDMSCAYKVTELLTWHLTFLPCEHTHTGHLAHAAIE